MRAVYECVCVCLCVCISIHGITTTVEGVPLLEPWTRIHDVQGMCVRSSGLWYESLGAHSSKQLFLCMCVCVCDCNVCVTKMKVKRSSYMSVSMCDERVVYITDLDVRVCRRPRSRRRSSLDSELIIFFFFTQSKKFSYKKVGVYFGYWNWMKIE